MNVDSPISAQELARIHGFAGDYIARLARTGEIAGRKVGRKWFVSQADFEAYLAAQQSRKSVQRKALAEARRKEYGLRARISIHPTVNSEARSLQELVQVKTAPVVSHLRHKAMSKMHMLHGTVPVGIVPAYPVSPAIDFLHKLVALLTSLILVFGTYSLYDAQYRVSAGNTLTMHAQQAYSLFNAIKKKVTDMDHNLTRGEYIHQLATAVNSVLDF